MTDDFRESFLRMNANVDFMAVRLADIFRYAMRAVASPTSGTNTLQATEAFHSLLDLMARADELSTFELFEKAFDMLRVEGDGSLADEELVQAAQTGMKFLTERSCGDNAARARASQREGDFRQAIQWFLEAKEERRRGRK